MLGPTSPGKWGVAGYGNPGGIVTWSISTTSYTGDVSATTPLASFMPVGFKTQIQNALNAWSTVANIQFVEVPDSGLDFNDPSATAGMIRFAGENLGGPNGTLAHGFYPPNNGSTAAGDIHFDTNETWKLSFGGSGFSIFQVAAHEIGHAIGLDHTAVANSLMNPFYSEAFSGPQADDIAAPVHLRRAGAGYAGSAGLGWLRLVRGPRRAVGQ